MSSATGSSPPALSSSESSSLELLAWISRTLAASVRALAFWTAVLLPFVVFAAISSGLVATAPTVVVGLVVANAVCAVLGHDHYR